MSEFISVETDIEQAQKALDGTSKSLKAIQRKTLGVISSATVKVLKAAIRSSGLQKRTGELLKAYRYKIKRNNSEANIYPKALNGEKSIFPKVMALSYGSEKRNIKPHGFVIKGKDYVNNGQYMSEVDKMIQKELDKYWG